MTWNTRRTPPRTQKNQTAKSRMDPAAVRSPRQGSEETGKHLEAGARCQHRVHYDYWEQEKPEQGPETQRDRDPRQEHCPDSTHEQARPFKKGVHHMQRQDNKTGQQRCKQPKNNAANFNERIGFPPFEINKLGAAFGQFGRARARLGAADEGRHAQTSQTRPPTMYILRGGNPNISVYFAALGARPK